ncbi:MazG-like family protein [Streptomyces abyssalis]|uniref:MazG-like family protein n=1 Tax=Streptomyces abyssalis TaxID=933944 RepID=UPI00085CDB82|nr:MazG-like family protein [Streptomyces abyssalis]
MTPDQWATIRRLVEWLDSANGDGEQETAMRLMKLAEESGEVMQAYIGTTGQNPRKGRTHTSADVAAELCDVILTAAVALHRFTGDPAAALDARIGEVARRSLVPHGPEPVQTARDPHGQHQPHEANEAQSPDEPGRPRSGTTAG